MEVLQVLVVDDEPGIRSGVRRILEPFRVSYPFMDEDIGFSISEAATGEEAVEIIKSVPPDILLLDNKLPGINGIDVLDFINRNQFDIEVMMITSFASLELAVRATQIGAYDFVPKPFSPQDLRSSMENLTKHLFLKRMTRKLNKEGKQIRFRFLSVLSHELKTPLNAIEGYLRMIGQRDLGEDLSGYDEMIEKSLARVKSMRNLIMDMLDLTKIESGKKSRVIQPVDLVKVLSVSVDSMQPLAIQMDVTVKVETPNSLVFPADAEEMEIVFNNLLSNAIKYNQPGGRVVINMKSQQDLLLIEFTDTGIGIPEDEIDQLFKDFVRIKNQQTRHIAGSGLGLSIVKRIVDLYSGKILVKSTPDKGSVFSLLLPINQ